MFTLRMADHLLKSGHGQVIEVWNGDVFMGAIYPTSNGIKVISKQVIDVVGADSLPLPISEILINLIKEESSVVQEESESECEMHGSVEHMQSVTGKCPGCGKP